MSMKYAENGKRSANAAPFLINRRTLLVSAAAAAVSSMLPTDLSALAVAPESFNRMLLPSADEVWHQLEEMVGFGPRYTGSTAHKKYVDFLSSHLEAAGLQVHHDTYTLPRWQPVKWSLKAQPAGGNTVDLPVTFYYPQSGQTSAQGVRGALVYAGTVTSNNARNFTVPSDIKGKIVFLEYQLVLRDYGTWYDTWGMYPTGAKLPAEITSIIGVAAPLLTGFKQAGAAAVILGWKNLSSAQAKNQNLPFGHALQELPAVWVGPEASSKLRDLASSGASATVTLIADVFPDTATDTVYGILPGASNDEILIINTHTDGPNGIQENGGIGLLAFAKAFSKIPRSQRNRTLVFALTTGHYASAYVPSIRGFIKKHPEIMEKTVGSVAIEHLGCREWLDDASLEYRATGRFETSFAVTKHEPVGRLMLNALQGTASSPVAVVSPTPKGRYLGEGGAIAATNIPTLGYFAGPSYLNMEAPDGCLSKLDKAHMHEQIVSLAKLIVAMDATSASGLRGSGPMKKAVLS
ncbi:MAG TPA: hypothetical protein VHY48_10275 [Acidobacteriaceae bacterium]|jgi:hypothetical protein|nr:hypothetical protein [Acidobacteriaceae bacterium]